MFHLFRSLICHQFRWSLEIHHFLAFCIWGANWRHLANTTEPSVCGGDAVLCQITLTTCYYYSACAFVVRLMLVFVFIAVVASCVNSCSGGTRWTLWERCLRRAASRTTHPTDRGFRKESWRISTVNDGASSKKSAFTHSVFLLMCYYISRESYTTRNVCVSRCLCLSVRSRMPTLLHGPWCNLGEW